MTSAAYQSAGTGGRHAERRGYGLMATLARAGRTHGA
jgi:hypothetical protein